MKKDQKKLLLFDADGVIVDSFENVYLQVKKFIKQQNGAGLPRDEYLRFMETSTLTNILKKAGLDSEQKAIAPELIDIFFENYHENKLMEGMPELIEELAKDHIIVIITSSLSSYVGNLFDSQGILSSISGILGADAAIHKDEKIRIALEEFKIPINKAVFVTDTIGDVAEAKKTGIMTIGVTWGYHPRETMERGKPDFIVDTPDELRKALK